jgi:hypothetical protein
MPVVVNFRYTSGGDRLLHQCWSSVIPVVVIFRYHGGGDLPLYPWLWYSVTTVVVICRYTSGGDLPLHHWWWSSVITVIVIFPYTSDGELPLHQWWWKSVILILRILRVLANAILIIACRVMKDLEDLSKSASSVMVQYIRRTWADYTNGWSALCYVTHSWDAKLGITQAADEHRDECSDRIAYWTTQRLSKWTVYRRQTFRSVLRRVLCLSM